MTGINNMQEYCLAWQLLLPETILILTILITSLWNLFLPRWRAYTASTGILGSVISFCYLLSQWFGQSNVLFGGLFTVDHLTIVFGLISLVVGMVIILMTSGYEQHLGKHSGEFYAITLTAVLAVMLLSGATDLIMLFVGIETLTICGVMLAGFTKRDKKSSEASLKYLLSMAATTATLLYGLSFLYGLTGSTSFDVIREQMAYLSPGPSALLGVVPPTSLLVIFLLVLILSAIGFKLAAAPFHMWAPDVYEGAPTPVTAFLSIGSKAGGLVVALRLLLVVFRDSSYDWGLLLALLSILSLVAGNLIALAQTSFKRLLAYSSIAHVGYILIGFVGCTQINNMQQMDKSLSSIVFYIVVYGAMNLGAFAGAILFTNETGSDLIDDYAGLMRKRPILALLLSVCLINLAGLPIPPAGFFAKVFIFMAGFSSPLVAYGIPIGPLLVAIALLTTIPAIFYYMRVVIKMIVQEPSKAVAALPDHLSHHQSKTQFGPRLALVSCTVMILAAGTWMVDPIMNLAHSSIEPIMLGSNTGNVPGSFLNYRR